MALLLLVSLILNIYLINRILTLSPVVGGERLAAHLIAPILPTKVGNTASLAILQNDDVFFSRLRDAVSQFSDLPFNYTDVYLGEVEKYKQLKIRVSGSEKNRVVFTMIVKKLLMEQIWTDYGFQTHVVSYSTQQDPSSHIVTFLFALDDIGLAKLKDWVRRDVTTKIPDKVVAKDAALDEELKKNGL